ncbi:hypothetical protein Tco_0134532 [Tanacetum coccineum]
MSSIEDNPESHSGSMSSMKNLEDTDNFGHQFLYDKPTKDDQEKSKVVNESDSTIPDHLLNLPTVVDKYLGTKLDDALLKILERHTTDLIEKYSVLPGPESIKTQESKKSPKEIIRIKREQECSLQTHAKEQDCKQKSCQLPSIADEDAMDKEVKDSVKDHKRKHDSDDDEDDDDDEGPSAGSNQGKSTKRRRHDSGASGSTQPPHKDDEQSSKKPQDSDASASKQHPTLTSTGWQITNTRDTVIDSLMHNSEPESGHSEHSSKHSFDDISKQDEGHVSDLEDTDNTHIPKVKDATWFKPIQEDKRPATPEPEWTIPRNDFLEPENNWANAYATTYQVPRKNKLQRKMYDIGSFIKWFCRRTGKKKLCKANLEGPAFNLVKAFHKNNVFLQFQMDECHKLLTNKTFEKYGYNYLREIILCRPDYKEYKISEKDFKNLHPNDFEDLYLLNIQDKLNHLSKSGKTHLHTAVNMWIRNLVIRNRVGDLQLGIESYQTKLNLECPNWDATDYFFKEDYTIVPKPRAVIYRDRNDQRKLMRLNEIHKFSDGTLTRVMEKLDHMVKDFHLFEYNKGMETRKWSEDDKRRSKDFITAIEKRLQIRRIFRSLESFVGGRIRDIDYRLINRTT